MGKLLAFDQSTTCTGYCVLFGGDYGHSGIIDFSTKEYKALNTAERFNKMYESILELIRIEDPDRIVFEDVQNQGNPYTFQLLAQLQGTIIGACYMLNVPFFIYKPTEWRKVLEFEQGPKIKRPQLKQQAKDFVKREFGIETSEDESDAICIGSAFIRANKI